VWFPTIDFAAGFAQPIVNDMRNILREVAYCANLSPRVLRSTSISLDSYVGAHWERTAD
jgi:hypothetical protein